MARAQIREGSLLSVTYKLTTSDTATALAAAKYLVDLGGSTGESRRATQAIITVEDDEIRVGFGVDPTQAGLGHRFSVGDVIDLQSFDMIRNFRYISADSAAHAVLQVTIEF